MWIILASLVLGIVIGIIKIIPDRFMKYNSRFQQIGVILLLFSMGASIGANKELIVNIKSMGVKAITFAVITTISSILAVYFISSRFIKGGEEN